MRGSAASSASEANDLPDELMDVPQIADYPHVSKMSVYKLIERQKIPATSACQERRAGRDAARHGQQHSSTAHLRTWMSTPIRTLPDSRSYHLQNRHTQD